MCAYTNLAHCAQVLNSQNITRGTHTHTHTKYICMYVCIYSLDPCHHDAHVAVPPRCPCPFRCCHRPSDRVHDRVESLGSHPDCSRCMIVHCPNACGISRACADRPWTNSLDSPPFCSTSGRHNVCGGRKLFSATVLHAHSNTHTHTGMNACIW